MPLKLTAINSLLVLLWCLFDKILLTDFQHDGYQRDKVGSRGFRDRRVQRSHKQTQLKFVCFGFPPLIIHRT